MEKRKAILLPPDPFQWKDRNIPTPTYAGPAKKSSSPMSTPISKALRLHFRNCSAVILGFPFRGSCQPQADWEGLHRSLSKILPFAIREFFNSKYPTY